MVSKKERMAADPEYREHVLALKRASSKRRRERVKNDPIRLAHEREVTKAYNAKKYAEDPRTDYHVEKARIRYNISDEVREKKSNYGKERRLQIKENFFEMYGDICNCCGESERLFLSLDHVQNDGHLHRTNYKDNRDEYLEAIRVYNPSVYQTLCHNCNQGKHRNGGVCPHKTKDLNTHTAIS